MGSNQEIRIKVQWSEAVSRRVGLALFVSIAFAYGQSVPTAVGQIVVRGKQLYRDGRPWIPHGDYQIAFEVAPENLSRADHPFWKVASANYAPEEYTEMRDAGADTVRIQIAQPGADPDDPLFNPKYVKRALAAVRSARAAGLTVILCVQDESHVPGEQPIDLPDNGTRRVWASIAPEFANDRGVMLELLNEPRPEADPHNWHRWKKMMTETVRVVRKSGATNVLIADGLNVGQTLKGAPMLDDPQVAYASHPYALQQFGQTKQAWDNKFGDFARRAPVIVTEWHFGGFFCNSETPRATVEFIRYLQQHGIGVVVGTWDWAPAGFGNARWGFPHARFSSFRGLTCHQPGYGLGLTIEKWYRSGVPASFPE